MDIRSQRANARLTGPPGGNARRAAFPSQMRGQFTTAPDGRSVYSVEGYATVFDRGYTMYDAFGKYTEVADAYMLDRSLAAKPDVAFLTNHSGVTMARTTNGSLSLAKDSHGLAIRATLNAKRIDVQDLASAIDDSLITEMSFAFVIEEGEWNEDFSTFTLKQVDINRGDVSAVNYGANPYTSIGSMTGEFSRLAARLPDCVKRSVLVADAEVRLTNGGTVALAEKRLAMSEGTLAEARARLHGTDRDDRR